MRKYTENDIYSIENAMIRYKNIAKFLQNNKEKCKTMKDVFESLEGEFKLPEKEEPKRSSKSRKQSN